MLTSLLDNMDTTLSWDHELWNEKWKRYFFQKKRDSFYYSPWFMPFNCFAGVKSFITQFTRVYHYLRVTCFVVMVKVKLFCVYCRTIGALQAKTKSAHLTETPMTKFLIYLLNLWNRLLCSLNSSSDPKDKLHNLQP